jgi:hypothetical protein
MSDNQREYLRFDSPENYPRRTSDVRETITSQNDGINCAFHYTSYPEETNPTRDSQFARRYLFKLMHDRAKRENAL